MNVCCVCGGSLEGRHELTCSPGCRREVGRVRAVLDGRPDGPYRTLEDLYARQRRAKRCEEA